MERGQSTNAAIFAAAVLLALLAAPMMLGHVYVADDLGEFHLPLRAYYAKQLVSGEPFDWCPDLYCGFYLTGEGQVGMYHPLHLLLYHTMPLPLAFDLECWLSYPAMLLGTVMLLQRRRLRFSAALFGAIAFTFGSFNFLHFVHPNAVAVVAHLPWLLWAIDAMLVSEHARQRRLAFAAIAALTGSQWLLGYPQYVFFSLIVEAGYVVFLQCSLPALRERRFARNVKSTSSWLAAVVIGTLIGSVQLLPTFDALQYSVRQSTATATMDPGSLHPLNLLQLVGPYLFETRVAGQNTHELACYMGAVPLVLAVYGVVHGRQRRRYRPVIVAALAAAVFGLLWSFGSNGPLGWLQTNAPLIDKFRLPCRALVISQLAAATLAAVGFAILLRRQCDPKVISNNRAALRRLWLLPAVSVLAVGLALLLWPQYLSAWPYLIVGPASIAIAAGLLCQADRGATWAVSAMVIATAVDLGAYGLSYAVVGHTMPLGEFIRTTEAPPGRPDCRVALDLLAGSQSAPGDGGVRIGNRILLTGWKRADGYAGLEPARRLDYRERAALQVAGVGWQLQQSSEHSSWTQRSGFRPRAWLVTQVAVSDTPSVALPKLAIDRAAIVDEAFELSAAVPGMVAIQADRPGEFLCQTECSTRQLLVVNESHHPGWQAEIDGHFAAVLRTNGDFLGVVVPAGRHEIHLQFRPASLKIGRLVSSCGLGLLVAALLAATGQTRRNTTPPHASLPSVHQR